MAAERKAENFIGLLSQAQFDAQRRMQRPTEARLRKKVDSVVIEPKQIS